MNDTTFREAVRSEEIREHKVRKAREEAHQDREERLTDALRPADWHTPYHARLGETCTLECGCTATKTVDGWQWDDEIVCPEHNPRGPIDVWFDRTPGLWVAVRRNEYDGFGSPLGMGKTREAAKRELLDAEDAREEMRAAKETFNQQGVIEHA